MITAQKFEEIQALLEKRKSCIEQAKLCGNPNVKLQFTERYDGRDHHKGEVRSEGARDALAKYYWDTIANIDAELNELGFNTKTIGSVE